MSRETRLRWEPAEPLPEGWRKGAQWLRDDGDMDVLYTSAPPGTTAYGADYKFVRLRAVVQERFVTEWRDAALRRHGPGRTGPRP